MEYITAKKIIMHFFGLSDSQVRNTSTELIEKMITALDKDDFEKLHHLGYELEVTK